MLPGLCSWESREFPFDDPHIPEEEKKEAQKRAQNILALPTDTQKDFE